MNFLSLPAMGSLPLTLLDPTLWRPYQLVDLNAFAKCKTLVDRLSDRARCVPDQGLVTRSYVQRNSCQEDPYVSNGQQDAADLGFVQ